MRLEVWSDSSKNLTDSSKKIFTSHICPLRVGKFPQFPSECWEIKNLFLDCLFSVAAKLLACTSEEIKLYALKMIGRVLHMSQSRYIHCIYTILCMLHTYNVLCSSVDMIPFLSIVYGTCGCAYIETCPKFPVITRWLANFRTPNFTAKCNWYTLCVRISADIRSSCCSPRVSWR